MLVDAIAKLKQSLHGSLISRGDATYDESLCRSIVPQCAGEQH